MAPTTIQHLKVCTKCGTEKPLTADFFGGYNSTRRNRIQWNWRSYCNSCAQAVHKKANDLRYQRHRDKLLARVREDRKINPEKHREWNRRNTIKNKAPGSDYQKRRWSYADKQKRYEERRNWRKSNPDKEYLIWRKTYEKHKHKHLARSLRWRKANPQATAAIRDRRRARELGARGNYTRDDVKRILKKNGRLCFYCGIQLKKFHVDHFIPLARGGANAPDNLRLSCPPCNYRKGSRMPWEFMPGKFLQIEMVF